MSFKPWPTKAVSTCCDFACCAYGEQSTLSITQGKITPLTCQAFLTAQREKEPFPTCSHFCISNNLHIFCLFLPVCFVNLVCQLCWPGARVSLCCYNNWLRNSNSQCWNLNSHRFNKYCKKLIVSKLAAILAVF